jgi:hypothetical protein
VLANGLFVLTAKGRSRKRITKRLRTCAVELKRGAAKPRASNNSQVLIAFSQSALLSDRVQRRCAIASPSNATKTSEVFDDVRRRGRLSITIGSFPCPSNTILRGKSCEGALRTPAQ